MHRHRTVSEPGGEINGNLKIWRCWSLVKTPSRTFRRHSPEPSNQPKSIGLIAGKMRPQQKAPVSVTAAATQKAPA